MRQLKVPSLQHLARTWHPDPNRIAREYLALAKGGPTFSYEPLFNAVRDLLVLNVSYEQIAEGVRRGVKQPSVQANFLGLLPLIRDHFEGSLQLSYMMSPRACMQWGAD